jgi:probable HAF family extracellular repeat protein
MPQLFSDLGVLAGNSESWALGVSANGQVIVGRSWSGAVGFSGQAFMWTSELGTVDLRSWLISRGVNLTGWSLISANAVSADGVTIVGQAVDPGSMRRGFVVRMGAACYPNCDASTSAPLLNVNDFICFQTKFAAGDSYANCDGSTLAPVLNVGDFICFMNKYAAGCP